MKKNIAKRAGLPGCIYLNHGRYYWKVRLPGEAKQKAIPLKPLGVVRGRAVTDVNVAVEIARETWQRELFKSAESKGDSKTIAGMVKLYLDYAREYYGNRDGTSANEADNIKYGLIPLVDLFANLPPEEFGPLKLKQVREVMIEKGWGRTTVNKRIGYIKRMYKWAVGEQIIPASILVGLQAVEGLRRGRSRARETQEITPIAEEFVRRVYPYTSRVVADMMELQLLTGMRSGELVIMRPVDIDTSKAIWQYTPTTHKTAYRGHKRIIALGRQAQAILRPYLKRNMTDYCFSPKEAMAQCRAAKTRKTPLHYGNRPGTNRKDDPQRQPRDRYDPQSYGRAVKYAIIKANKAGVNVPHFHPHQLRHTAATRIRKEMGLDAARAALGHRNLSITDDYAELDQALASEVARRLG